MKDNVFYSLVLAAALTFSGAFIKMFDSIDASWLLVLSPLMLWTVAYAVAKGFIFAIFKMVAKKAPGGAAGPIGEPVDEELPDGRHLVTPYDLSSTFKVFVEYCELPGFRYSSLCIMSDGSGAITDLNDDQIVEFDNLLVAKKFMEDSIESVKNNGQ